MEDDDDDFGDLYTDVLRPISDPPPPQPPPPISCSSLNPPRPLDFNLEEEEEEEGDDEDFFPGGPDPKFFSLRPQTLASDPLKDSVKPIDLRQSSRRDDADGEFRFEEEEEHNNQKEEIGTRVSAEEVVATTTNTTATPAVPNVDMVPESLKPKFVSSGIGDKSRRLFMEKEEVEEEEEDNLEIDLDAEPTIPGLSAAGPFFPGVFDEEGAEEEEGSKKEEDNGGGGGGDDWDSDSDDDIQIVLNDNSARPGVDRMEGGGGEDEDGQDLVIVADVDHQPTEQHEFGEVSTQVTDGERKEIGEAAAAKPNGVMLNALGPRPSYISHGYHPHHSQFKADARKRKALKYNTLLVITVKSPLLSKVNFGSHICVKFRISSNSTTVTSKKPSMHAYHLELLKYFPNTAAMKFRLPGSVSSNVFVVNGDNVQRKRKYVRPGATTVPGGAIVGPGGVPGQVRPPFNVGSIGGSGRGEWRPIGIKTAPTLQKNFQSGFGFPAWGNNSSGSGFGRGLDYTLPSHKTVFDIDIDGFEEKPWRHPGVDTSDFFNFGLNEESWKDYCKQLGQLRLEATMQSKIRVYESGRSEQDYDPDLPPELAAATGIHDFTVENAHLSKTDGGQGDLAVQGRVNAHVRPPIPTGRAIQVEGGYGERLPSADTRPPRIRDPDAIIEIVLQDSMDDESITANSNLEGPENELQAEDQKGEYEAEEDIVKSDTGSPYNGLKKEMLGRQDPFMGSAHGNMHEGDGILPFPLQTPLHYHSVSKGHSPVYPSGSFDTTHDGRRPQGTARDKYHQVHLANAEHGNDVMPSLSARIGRVLDNEKSDGSSDVKQTSISSPPDQNESARVPATDHKSDMDNEIALTDKSVGVEGEVMGVDTMYPSDTTGDENLIHSVKKQKMSSQVEQPSMQNIDEGNNLKTKRSGETSKARSESSRDYRKRHDDGEEEVVQEKQARRMGDMRKYRDEDEHSFRKRGDCERDGRQEVDRYHNSIKGKDDSYYSHRDWDPNSAYQSHNMTRDFELSRDSNSTGVWQRRDEDAEVRRFKDEDTRKRERFEEIGSRHGSKVRESESIDRDEHLQSRTRLDNGEWRSGHDKVIGQRPRDRDDILMSRHENLSDPHTKRRKDEEHRSREQANKEISHDFRAREGSSRRKRERDDCSDERREDQPRLRDKPDDQPLIRHRNENWRQRERDDQPRLKQPQKDTLSNREREDGRGAVRSARGMEGRPLMGSAKAKDESKSSGFDKDYQFKDKRRHSEQPKRRDRQEDNTLSQNRGHEDVYARESNTKIEERNPRHEKSRTSNHHPVNDGQWSHKERQKGSSRSKESVGADQYTTAPNKKKQDDPSVHRNLKVSTKGMNESESGNILLASGPIDSGDPGPSRSSSSGKLPLKRSHLELEAPFPQQHHSSRNHHREQHASFSDDEPQNSSRRGRSELESSTSHKERSRNTNNTRSLSSLSKIKEPSNRNNDRSAAASKRPDEVSKKVVVDAIIDNQHSSSYDNLSEKDTINAHHDMGPPPTMPLGSNRDFESDKNGEGDRHHHHFDTVAKLKKRSERFKLPMPSEKDGTGNRMETSEAVSETGTTDAEIKHERPARKRRWISGS